MRIRFDDPSYSFEEPRASWDGQLDMLQEGNESLVEKLQMGEERCKNFAKIEPFNTLYHKEFGLIVSKGMIAMLQYFVLNLGL